MTDETDKIGDDITVTPHKSLLKRIDIGLVTGLCALLISFVGILTSRATFKMNQETQKVRVLPIIDIDMGYRGKPDATGAERQYFEVTLSNVGAGIAHIQSVVPSAKGEPLDTYEAFEDVIMTGRMRSWATLTEAPATGYLRAGDAMTPSSYRIGGSSGDLQAYLRGQWGTPLDGLDLKVCYCSVFDDCWTVSYADRKSPEPVSSCGIGETTEDRFRDYIDQRTAKRLASE